MEENSKCDAEVNGKIGMTKANVGKMRGILTNMSLNMQVRLRILKSYIWSRLIYGCESWPIRSDMKNIFEAVEMSILRRMFRVPWIARRTNLALFEMAGTSRQLMTTTRRW